MERFFLPKLKAILVFGLTLFFVVLAPSLTYSQSIKDSVQIFGEQVPVVLGEPTIFVLESRVGSFDQVTLTVTPPDVLAVSQPQQALAEQDRQQTISAQQKDQARFFKGDTKKSLIFIAVATIVVIVITIILNRIFARILTGLESWRQARVSEIRINEVELYPLKRIFQLLINTFKLLRLVALLTLFFFYVSSVLSRFTGTGRLMQSIKQELWTKLTVIGSKFLSSIPNLFIIALAIFICYVAISLVNWFFKLLERGILSLPGFYPEWALVTSRLITIFIIGFTLALIYPLLPGYESNAFKGISLFFGALISLGSHGIVADFLAGIELCYSRAFRVGDIIKIGNSMGEIVNLSLIITRFRTVNNEIVSLANTQLLNNQIINYSASARNYNAPLMLYTNVSLGYDVSLTDVHQALIAAAKITPHILHKPAPFVWQTSLDDFYVSYQLNVYTEQLDLMLMNTIYSELHANILKHCDEAGIEILSPHYTALRDGNESTLSTEHLTPESTIPGFRIYPINRDSHS